MKSFKNIFIAIIMIFGSILVFSLSSCHKDLEIEYLNQPDSEKAYSNPEDVYNIAADGFFNWYMTMNSSISPRMAMWVAADQGTCSWANSGMYHLSDEPRLPFNNDVSYTYASINSSYYASMYSTLNTMNKVLTKANEGMKFGENGVKTKMVRAYSHFIQGITLGYLGLVYDKAVILTENVDPFSASLSSYPEVLDSAIACLNKSIDICSHSNFSIPDSWINGHSYSDEELEQLCNSMIVRFMVYGSRNKAQNEEVDWEQVLELAGEGIQIPLAPYIDNSKYFCWYKHYTTARDGWARIDCRIINLMDPDYPSRFPADGVNPPQASSADNRLSSYFSFTASNNMKPERGYVHFSNYEFKRSTYSTNPDGAQEVVSFPVSENDLFRAEAHAMLNQLDEAIEIINSGTRTTLGNLPDLPANSTKEEVLEAIFYERDIELIQTGFGTAFFDMRRRDYLQKGTLLHFPVPGRELLLLSEPIYSFGGVNNADGIGTSNGGWD